MVEAAAAGGWRCLGAEEAVAAGGTSPRDAVEMAVAVKAHSTGRRESARARARGMGRRGSARARAHAACGSKRSEASGWMAVRFQH